MICGACERSFHHAGQQRTTGGGPCTCSCARGFATIEQHESLAKSVREMKIRIAQIEATWTADAKPPGAIAPLRETVKAEIVRALTVTKGHAALAAHALGLSPATLYRRLKEYGLDRDALRKLAQPPSRAPAPEEPACSSAP